MHRIDAVGCTYVDGERRVTIPSSVSSETYISELRRFLRLPSRTIVFGVGLIAGLAFSLPHVPLNRSAADGPYSPGDGVLSTGEEGIGIVPACNQTPDMLPADSSESWRQETRAKLKSLLHIREDASRGKPARVVDGSETVLPVPGTTGITGRELRLSVSDGQQIRVCVVYKPGENGPLVLALHGHSMGLPALFDPRCEYHAVAVVLAQEGFTVLALETRSFGASSVDGLQHLAYVNALRLHGREFLGEVVSDDMEILTWALDEEGLGESGKIAVCGLSMGGVTAMFLAGLDDRISVLLASGVGDSWQNTLCKEVHCPCLAIPGLLNVLDAPQLLMLSSCRMVALEGGTLDKGLGAAHVLSMGKKIERTMRASGKHLEVHTFEGDHEHDIGFVVHFMHDSFASPGDCR